MIEFFEIDHVECSTCKESIKYVKLNNSLVVDPCNNCLSKAKEEAFQEGIYAGQESRE